MTKTPHIEAKKGNINTQSDKTSPRLPHSAIPTATILQSPKFMQAASGWFDGNFVNLRIMILYQRL